MKITLKHKILLIGLLFVLAMNLLAGCGVKRNLPVTSVAPIDKSPISELLPTPTSTVQKIYPRDILLFQLGRGMAYLDETKIIPLDIQTNYSYAGVTVDGTKIITITQEGLISHDLRFKKVTLVPQPQFFNGSWWDGDWHPEGRFFVYNLRGVQRPDPKDPNTNIYDDHPTIYLADLDNNSYVRLTTGNIAETQPRWSPDGQFLAYISENNVYLKSTTCLSDLPTCENLETINLTHMKSNGYINNLAWSPIGHELGYTQYDIKTEKTDIFTVDLNGNIRNITNTPDTSVSHFDWSPDGNRIAYQRIGVLSNEDLCILSLSDHSIECLSNISTLPGNMLWSPDGTKIAVVNHTVDQVWELVIYSPTDKTTHHYQVTDLGFLISWATITGPIDN
jgi:hypothetical protein